MAANLTLANKNPFSTFDFLGYFIPGAFAIGLMYILTNGFQFEKSLMPPSIETLREMLLVHEGYVIFMLIFSSYIIGHLISYLSSVTVELFYIWCYGYTTDYLLLDHLDQDNILKSEFGATRFIWHIIICIIVLPLFICHFIVEIILNIKPFLSKRINDEMRNCLIKRINKLARKVGYEREIKMEDSSTSDIHRLVMHYVYENCQQHIAKYDNYVALYGFLRSLTLIFNLAFLYVVCRIMDSLDFAAFFNCWSLLIGVFVAVIVFLFAGEKRKVSLSNRWLCAISAMVVVQFVALILICFPENNVGEILQMLALFALTYWSYLGYTKFYRRFTLENLMSLLVCKDLDDGDSNRKNGGKG